ALKENREQFKQLLINLDRTTSNAGDTIESVNLLIKDGGLEQMIKSSTGSIERAAKNLEETSAGFKAMSGVKTQEDLQLTLTALRESTQALRSTIVAANGLISD